MFGPGHPRGAGDRSEPTVDMILAPPGLSIKTLLSSAAFVERLS